jgi:cephalosporin-C deacetylase-like acetyl esterase
LEILRFAQDDVPGLSAALTGNGRATLWRIDAACYIPCMRTLLRRSFICTFIVLIAATTGAQSLQVSTDRREAIYHRGESVIFRVTGGSGVADYVVSKDGYATLSSGTVTLGKAPVEIRASLDEPGIIHCDVTPRGDATTKPIKATGGAAVDPHFIKPSQPPPDDFDAYWDAQKKLLAAEPAKPVLTPVKSPDDSVQTFDLQINCPGGAPVSGYLAIPKDAKPKSLPAILYPHSAGVRSSDLPHAVHGAKLNLIALDINAHGLPNGKPDKYYADLFAGDLKGYPARGITEDRDHVYFRGMFLRLLRAIDYLSTRPEWDGKILIVQGSSQGGGQALVAAGLDQRVTLCLASVPALCDHTGFKANRASGWPRIVPKDASGKYDEKAAETARYFDAMNFATRIKCNTYVTVGFIDKTCAATSVYAAFNAIPGDNKQILPQPGMGHAFPKNLQDLFDQFVIEHIEGRHRR